MTGAEMHRQAMFSGATPQDSGFNGLAPFFLSADIITFAT
jgi:hypothetical protein